MEIYTISKCLRRDEKPDYQKLLKKVLVIMSKHNTSAKDSKKSHTLS